MTSLFDMRKSRNSRAIGWNAPDSSGSLRVRGFTLLELMVVLLILALLRRLRHAGHEAFVEGQNGNRENSGDALTASVNYFPAGHGRYPTEQEGLKVLVERPANEIKWDGPYVQKKR